MSLTAPAQGDAVSRDATGTNRRGWNHLLARLAPGRFGGRLGLFIVGIGLLVIGIGWNGAAGSGGEIDHVPVLQAQLPWLLSGGFLGLAIVAVGAAVLVSHAHREDRASLESRLETLIEAVGRLGGLGSTDVASDDLVGNVIAGPNSYHTRDCRLLKGRNETSRLTPEDAAGRGLTPCRVCRPPVVAGERE